MSNQSIETSINLLHHIYKAGVAGRSWTLSQRELEAINQGIGALKTLQDMKLHSSKAYGKIVSHETLNKKENTK